MDQETMRALMDLMGCCCCCCEGDEEVGPGRSRRGIPPLEVHLRPPGAGGKGRGGRLEMPPLKAHPVVDEPLLQTTPSYDSPQRPGGWGTEPHLPAVRLREDQPAEFAEGASLPPTLPTPAPDPLTLPLRIIGDDGRRLTLPREGGLVLDLGQRRVLWQGRRGGQVPGRSLEGGWWLLDLIAREGQPVPEVREGGARTDLVVRDVRSAGAGGQSLLITDEVWAGYDGTTGSVPVHTAQAPGELWEADCAVLVRTWPQGGQASRHERPVEAWRLLSGWSVRGFNNGTLVAPHVTRDLEYGYREEEGDTDLTWRLADSVQRSYTGGEPLPPDAPAPTAAGFPPGTTYTLTPLQGVFDQTYPNVPPDAPPREGPRWISPDGEVTVTGPPTRDHADLTGATLTAWGHAFAGGTWAALRDTPQRLPDGTWNFSGVVILHASGTTVTAVRPGGAPEAVSRAVFADRVLHGPFLGFSSVGAAHNTWPPAWALALGGGEVRAVAAWDPWRDLTRREWPGRPRRRPRTPPVLAPTLRPPLGLVLADVIGTATQDEVLRRAQAPFVLPARVEVWQEEAWVESGTALRALRKRCLYPPADWPEELDDRTHVRGRLRVTFEPYPFVFAAGDTTAALLLRVRTGRGELPVVRAGGVEGRPVPLGRSAGERGWQPALLNIGPYPVGEAAPLVYEVESAAPLSRLLLGYAPISRIIEA